MMITKIRTILIAAVLLYLAHGAQGASLPEFSYHVSNQRINVMAQAPDGYIWFGTAHGLNRHSGENFLTWYASDQPGDLNSDLIYDICFDAGGDMWIATECGIIRSSGGIFDNDNDAVNNPVHRVLTLPDSTIVACGRDGVLKFDRNQNVLRRFFVPGSSWLKTIATDEYGRVWAAVESGGQSTLFILDTDLQTIKEVDLGRGRHVRRVSACIERQMWIVYDDGIEAFSTAGMERIRRPSASGLAQGAGYAFVVPAGQGIALVGIHGRGMYMYHADADKCKPVFTEEKLTGEDYRALVDRDGNIWLSEYGKQYRVYPSRSECTNHAGILGAVGAKLIRTIAHDSRGRLWMSLDNGYAGYDPSTREILWRKEFPSKFTHLFVDSRGRLWIVSDFNTLERYNLSGSTTPVFERSFHFDSIVSSVSEDASGLIWVINNFEFHTIDADDFVRRLGPLQEGGSNLAHTMAITDMVTKTVYVNTVRFGLFECNPDGNFTPMRLGKGVSGINSLVSYHGIMWMGTYNQGLIRFNPATGKVRRFNISTGLSSNSIESVLVDGRGRIWFNTPSHIICYDPGSERFHTLYDYNFSDENFYGTLCACRTPDGKIFYGGYGGLTEVDDSKEFDDSRPDIPLHFEYIAVNGKQVDIPQEKLELSHKDRLLTVMYSGLNFNFGSLLDYSYMLEGFDSGWNQTDRIQISWPNLSPGKYTLRIRVRYLNGDWSSNELRLPITVHPSPWASTGAKCAYSVLLISAFAALTASYIRHRMRKKDLAMKQAHIDFISNISHELRTPLTLIKGPVGQLLKSSKLDAHDRAYLETIERNAERMRIISEEIIDSPDTRRKEESLLTSPTDLSSFVYGVCANFRFAAMEKRQTLTTDIHEGVSGWIDAPKVEKILVNLISNACKYTPEGGSIHIALSVQDGRAVFSVSDNGAGIPEDKARQLFQRYERLDARGSGVTGSGIGLNYAMSLARLHKGTLEYSPAAEGSGSVFVFSVPVARSAYSESEISDSETVSRFATEQTLRQKEFNPALPTLLVAEDNPEIRILLYDILSGAYNVLPVSDGAEAWENLKIAVPDAVVSDVVMPQKDGYTLCREIKASPEFCHIPVVLLTAKRDNLSAVQGLSLGADAYIGKPFDPDYLRASVDSLIANRRRVQQRVQNLTPQSMEEEEAVQEASLNEQELAFLRKVHDAIEQHIEEESFSIEAMSREVGASYSTLYARIKALTGQTPQEFISTYKMNRAMELLKTGQYNVTEVSEMIGASSPFNFSRDFKKHFGVTPSSVRKK